MPSGAEFVRTFRPEKMFRVPRNLFPLAIDPKHVSAEEAHFMRPSDWVIGVRIGNHVRCYPAWILDNYHAVNDTLAGEPIAVMHCEICCSNAAYLANLNGRRITFGTAGLFGGTLSVYDLETQSNWSHGMGVAFEGPLAGTSLHRIESFQATWREWNSFFPQTTVLGWPRPECHPDGRHGHGSRDTFARAGMYVEAVSTMDTGNDDRLPEHEMVITLNLENGQAALPLREIARAGGLFQMEVGGRKLVSISAGPASSFAGTFERHLAGGSTLLDFKLKNGRVEDLQTGSVWRADGLAVNGPLREQRLEPVPAMLNKWHSLACFLRNIPVLKHEGPPAPVTPTNSVLKEIQQVLRDSGFSAEPDYELYTLELPNGATHGLRMRIDGDPFDVLLFEDDLAAADDGLARRHSVRAGALVLASTPEKLFRDTLNSRPLPENEIAWSTLLGNPRLQQALSQAATLLRPRSHYCAPGIADFKRSLEECGYEVTVYGISPQDTLPVGARTGIRLAIGGDPFLVYRFPNPQAAAACAQERQQSLAAGPLVLCSDPDDIYQVPAPISTLRKPDSLVSWSKLLHDINFTRVVESICRKENPQRSFAQLASA
jgi:hypothetical protein